MIVRFTQAAGFSMLENDALKYSDEAEEAWRKRLGYRTWCWRLGALEEDDEGFWPSANAWEGSDPALPKFYVAVSFGDRFSAVMVDDEAELLALWLRLSSIVNARMAEELPELVTCARRAFRALHGHDSDRPCSDCDPSAVHLAALRARSKQEAGAR